MDIEILQQIFATVLAIQSALGEIRERLAGSHKELLTVEELSQLVGRAPYTVRSWVKSGKIRAERVTGTGPRGRLLISRDQVQKLVSLGNGGQVPPV